MIDATVIDDLSRRLGKLLPPGVVELKEDFERNARAAVQSALGELELVTREEFDVQREVLQRTRQRLQALEARVAALEPMGTGGDGADEATGATGTTGTTGAAGATTGGG